MKESPLREPLLIGEKSYAIITADITAPIRQKPHKLWFAGITLSSLLAGIGVFAMSLTVWQGTGLWGINRTIGWGWAITNLVWWIGIGHAGTFISAILLLFRQKWRTSINRSAEAMTIFAVMCAGIFPLIHMGRLPLAHYILPYPNTRGVWVNFNSPLLWDVVAISTYLLVSVLFWYMGMIPDLATLRDRVKNKYLQPLYKFLSLGWTGSARHWSRHESMSLVLAGLAAPLVLSVHSIVSFDFATSVIPGWHTTIFPPYFVAGAIFSGFAMVLTLMLIARKAMNLEDYITIGHVESMNKIIIAMGSIVGIAYITELFMAWYSGSIYERFVFYNRAMGPYAWAYWIMMSCNVLWPQLLWFRRLRRSLVFTFILSIFINVGMWFERFVIVVTSLHRDFLPSSWSMYSPTPIEIAIFTGSLGIFFTLFLLFIRFFPVIAIAEVKGILKTSYAGYPKNDQLQ